MLSSFIMKVRVSPAWNSPLISSCKVFSAGVTPPAWCAGSSSFNVQQSSPSIQEGAVPLVWKGSRGWTGWSVRLTNKKLFSFLQQTVIKQRCHGECHQPPLEWNCCRRQDLDCGGAPQLLPSRASQHHVCPLDQVQQTQVSGGEPCLFLLVQAGQAQGNPGGPRVPLSSAPGGHCKSDCCHLVHGSVHHCFMQLCLPKSLWFLDLVQRFHGEFTPLVRAGVHPFHAQPTIRNQTAVGCHVCCFFPCGVSPFLYVLQRSRSEHRVGC